MNRDLASALFLSLAVVTVSAADLPSSGTPPHSATGIDLPYMDKAIRAQDDFFKYVNGKWLEIGRAHV